MVLKSCMLFLMYFLVNHLKYKLHRNVNLELGTVSGTFSCTLIAGQ